MKSHNGTPRALRLLDKHHRLHAGNLKTLAAARILAVSRVIAAQHVGAQFGVAGPVAFVGAARHLRFLGAHKPAQFVFARLLAMRTIQGSRFHLQLFVEKSALVECHCVDYCIIAGSAGVRIRAPGDYGQKETTEVSRRAGGESCGPGAGGGASPHAPSPGSQKTSAAEAQAHPGRHAGRRLSAAAAALIQRSQGQPPPPPPRPSNQARQYPNLNLFRREERSMKLESLRELFVQELQDLYSAENMIIKALPKIMEKSSSPDLKNALDQHLQQTRGQVRRLDQIFDQLPKVDREDRKCKGMEGVIKEGEEILKEDGEPEVRDAGIISAAQRVEHYEMAGYGTVRTYAKLLGHNDWAQLLQQTLDEEKEADRILNGLSERINLEAKAA